jgi:peptidoglycan hydrolase CwlO-like protein
MDCTGRKHNGCDEHNSKFEKYNDSFITYVDTINSKINKLNERLDETDRLVDSAHKKIAQDRNELERCLEVITCKSEIKNEM